MPRETENSLLGRPPELSLKNEQKSRVLDKAEVFDSTCDPVLELGLDAEERMKVTRVDGRNLFAANVCRTQCDDFVHGFSLKRYFAVVIGLGLFLHA